MAVLLGLVAAIGFGSSDFLGGHASRRSRELSVLAVVQVVGLALASVFAIAEGSPFPDGGSVAAAALAGACGVTGLGLLYRALATGRMGVAAPVSAVIASVLAVAWGFSQGERPSGPATAGVVLAVLAVALVSGDGRGTETWSRPLVLAVAAGVFFGFSVVGFSEAAEGGGMWPLLVARGAATPLVLLALAVTRTPPVPARPDVPSALGAAVLDVSGNAALVGGFQHGLTSLVAPIAALFPAVTVGLARVVLGESLTRHQMIGFVLALTGLVLIAT